MYGQDDNKRYNGLQSEFFERAASGISRREYLLGLVALGEEGGGEGGRRAPGAGLGAGLACMGGWDAGRAEVVACSRNGTLQRFQPAPASSSSPTPKTKKTGGGGSLLVWGAKGSKDAKLPITIGPLMTPEVGPRGRV